MNPQGQTTPPGFIEDIPTPSGFIPDTAGASAQVAPGGDIKDVIRTLSSGARGLGLGAVPNALTRLSDIAFQAKKLSENKWQPTAYSQAEQLAANPFVTPEEYATLSQQSVPEAAIREGAGIASWMIPGGPEYSTASRIGLGSLRGLLNFISNPENRNPSAGSVATSMAAGAGLEFAVPAVIGWISDRFNTAAYGQMGQYIRKVEQLTGQKVPIVNGQPQFGKVLTDYENKLIAQGNNDIALQNVYDLLDEVPKTAGSASSKKMMENAVDSIKTGLKEKVSPFAYSLPEAQKGQFVDITQTKLPTSFWASRLNEMGNVGYGPENVVEKKVAQKIYGPTKDLIRSTLPANIQPKLDLTNKLMTQTSQAVQSQPSFLSKAIGPASTLGSIGGLGTVLFNPQVGVPLAIGALGTKAVTSPFVTKPLAGLATRAAQNPVFTTNLISRIGTSNPLNLGNPFVPTTETPSTVKF